MKRTEEQQRLSSLTLFRDLIKDGCKWEGDVVTAKWSEILYFDAGDDWVVKRVRETLYSYDEGVDYRLEDGGVWIA